MQVFLSVLVLFLIRIGIPLVGTLLIGFLAGRGSLSSSDTGPLQA